MAELKVISNESYQARGIIAKTDADGIVLEVEVREPATSGDLFDFMNSKNIVEGIKHEVIEELFERLKTEPEANAIVAEGKAMISGVDGKFEWLIDMSEKKVQVTDDEGNVDFRDKNLIKEIYSGHEILKVIPPSTGEDGINIFGQKSFASAGAKAKLRLGKNVEQDDEKGVLIAKSDGHVEFVDPLVSVNEDFEVFKDIDFSIGNLNFIGGLIINGDVPPGYTLEAGRDILITGISNASNLIAKGDITVNNGINGSTETRIECEGILKSKYINEANVTAKKGVEVNTEIVRSKIKSLGEVIIEFGCIRGGEICAFNGITVKELGAPMGTPTLATVGVDYSVDSRIAKLNGAKSQLEDEQKKLEEAIAPFMKNKLLLIKSPPQKQAAVKTILTKIDGLKKKQKQVDEMVTKQEASRHNRYKEITVLKTLKEDVVIQIGNKKKKFVGKYARPGIAYYDKTAFEVSIKANKSK